MHNMSFIKGIRIIFLCNPYSQPFTMGFLQMEFQDISDEELVLSAYKKDDTNICTMNYKVFLTPDWTNLWITEAFKVDGNKRSISLEETIFSPLCYYAE